MNIAVDIDEVLTPTVAAFVAFLKDKGINKKVEDFRSLNWKKIAGISQDEMVDLVYEFYKTEHFLNILPVSGSVDALQKLSKSHTLFVLSSRQRFIEEITKQWINNHFPNVFHKIFVCDNHYDHRSEDPIEKADVCLEHDIHLLIEDDPHHITYAISKGIKVIVMDRPWNSEIKDVVRVKDWIGVMAHFDSIKILDYK